MEWNGMEFHFYFIFRATCFFPFVKTCTVASIWVSLINGNPMINGYEKKNEMINGMVKEMINGMINRMINRMINGMINGICNSMSNGNSHGMRNGMINEKTNGMIIRMINGMTGEMFNRMSNLNLTILPRHLKTGLESRCLAETV